MALFDYAEILQKNLLFKDIPKEDLNRLINCLSITTRDYQKGNIILLEGEMPVHLWIIASGRIKAVKGDSLGNETLIATHGVSESFGEVLASAANFKSPITIIAESDTTVIEILYSRLINGCSNGCQPHKNLILNLLKDVSQKYWGLFKKIEYMAVFTLKKRVCMYLFDLYNEKSPNSKEPSELILPYDRAGLAAYLNADRSALCRTLSCMKKEGIIDYKKNKFIIKDLKKLKENNE